MVLLDDIDFQQLCSKVVVAQSPIDTPANGDVIVCIAIQCPPEPGESVVTAAARRATVLAVPQYILSVPPHLKVGLHSAVAVVVIADVRWRMTARFASTRAVEGE